MWLRRRADLVEVVQNNPGKTRSGTCPLCDTLDGEPTSEVGRPPFHPNCACKPVRIQRTIQPEEVLLEDEFEVDIPPTAKPLPDPGGVVDLDEMPLEDEL